LPGFGATADNCARNKEWEAIFDRLIELRERDEGLQKHSGFGDLLLNKECAPAANEFADHDLHDRKSSLSG
jgi:hypothetical protein